MSSNEQGIIKMLQDQINESEEKIKSFRQAISALSGGGATAVASAKPGKRRGRKPGSKNKAKAAAAKAAPAAKATPVKAVRRRRRKRGRKANVASKPAAPKIIRRRSAKAAKPKSSRKTRAPRSGETMEGWVLKQFEDNTPKTARTLMERYNKDTGKKLEMNGFSARLAIIKKKGNVKSMKNAADGLSYNGRSEWFDGAKLKKDYLPKG